jgi:hypothetical protein
LFVIGFPHRHNPAKVFSGRPSDDDHIFVEQPDTQIAVFDITVLVIEFTQVEPVKSLTAPGHVESTDGENLIAFSGVEFDFHWKSSAQTQFQNCT